MELCRSGRLHQRPRFLLCQKKAAESGIYCKTFSVYAAALKGNFREIGENACRDGNLLPLFLSLSLSLTLSILPSVHFAGPAIPFLVSNKTKVKGCSNSPITPIQYVSPCRSIFL
jgi:hypothetical protein